MGKWYLVEGENNLDTVGRTLQKAGFLIKRMDGKLYVFIGRKHQSWLGSNEMEKRFGVKLVLEGVKGEMKITKVNCNACGRGFPRIEDLEKHIKEVHMVAPSPLQEVVGKEVPQAQEVPKEVPQAQVAPQAQEVPQPQVVAQAQVVAQEVPQVVPQEVPQAQEVPQEEIPPLPINPDLIKESWTIAKLKKVAAMVYRDRLPIKEVAGKLGVSESTVPQLLQIYWNSRHGKKLKEILELKNRGLSIKEITKLTGMDRASVYWYLRTYLPPKSYSRLGPKEVEEMKALREKGFTVKQIAQKFGIKEDTYYFYMRKYRGKRLPPLLRRITRALKRLLRRIRA